jgi:hypothetical protein
MCRVLQAVTLRATAQFLTLAICLCSADAIAQRLPTDTELRAAYCTRIIRNEVNVLRDMLQRNSLQEARDKFQSVLRDREIALNRLNSYFMPLVGHVQELGLYAAIGRANADIEASAQAASRWVNCVEQFTAQVPLNVAGIPLQLPGICGTVADCESQCGAPTPPDLASRFEGCRKPDWLPF